MRPNTHTTTTRSAGAAALLAAALLGACGTPGGISAIGQRLTARGATADPSDFVVPEGETPTTRVRTGPAIEPDDTPDLIAGGDGDTPTTTRRPVPGSTTGPGGLVTRPGTPTPDVAATANGQPVLIDAKVGDLNGRPIFADDFLRPIADRLRAESQRLPPEQWRAQAFQLIVRRIQEVLADELLRSEALSSLSPDVRRQGIRNFVESVRERMVSESGGSEQRARRQLRETTGKTLEEEIRDQRESALVSETVRSELLRRVNISWRDIVQRYERDIDKYNPPPTAYFRLVRVATSDTASMDAVKAMLTDGVPFEDIATSDFNNFNRDEGGTQAEQLGADGYEHTEFFGPQSLNELAWTLKPGQIGGPVEFGSQSAWLKLERVEKVTIPLYEAQLAIALELRQERLLEEQGRYINRLVERAHVTGIEDLAVRLLEIAEDRYGPRPN